MLELHYPTVTKTILERQYPGKPTLKVAFGNGNGAISKTPRSCALLSSWRHDGQDRADKQTTKFTPSPLLINVVINWYIDIRWPASPDRNAGSSVDPSWSSNFLKLSADKLPVSNDRRFKSIFSNDSYEICCVYVIMAPHCQHFDFKLTSDAKIQSAF